MYIVQRQILKVVDNWSIISTALATLHFFTLMALINLMTMMTLILFLKVYFPQVYFLECIFKGYFPKEYNRRGHSYTEFIPC